MIRPVLAATAVAVALTGAAYVFGPDAQADPAASAPQDSGAGDPAVSVPQAAAASASCAVEQPKRQLRGVWIATTQNIDWPSRAGLTPERQRAEYLTILENAAKRRLNAVFVQVRPAGDALYRSPYEPWSQYLTGTAGKDPGWDPLPFLIDEAHKRGLEFHAWFNPYRAAYTDDAARLPANHPARVHPKWTVKHEGRLYFNPGLPEVREHVTKVVTDVVRRYDVDGVHFDDYFYPYPGKGTEFDDAAAFTKYGKGMSLAGWRRDNVNRLVAQVHQAVHAAKRHVKFGISPFGIWRNKAQDPKGSATKGMSAYDAIYADARAWIKAGTVDYVMPQLYWPRGFAVADYDVLVPWWAGQVKGTGVDLYIGQALYRVGSGEAAWDKPGELSAHLTVNRRHPEVKGDVYFSAKQLISNPRKALDRLVEDHYSRPALLPLIQHLTGPAPAAVTGLKRSGTALTWRPSPGARAYAVYRTDGPGGECATADGRNLTAVIPATAAPSFPLRATGTYHVTALDRLHQESAPVKLTVARLP